MEGRCSDALQVRRARDEPTGHVGGRRGVNRGSTPLVDPSWGSPQASFPGRLRTPPGAPQSVTKARAAGALEARAQRAIGRPKA